MASMGMMGALGGVGSTLMNDASVMQANESADKDIERKKNYQQWLMQAQDEFDVKKDARAWQNEQDRAPAKAQMLANADVAKKGADLTFTTQNRDAITANLQADTNAKSTPEKRAEDAAHAKYWGAVADDVAVNGKTKGSGLDKSGTRLEPDDEMEYKSLDAQGKELNDKIATAKANGTWTDQKDKDGNVTSGTPQQRQLETQLAAIRLRQQAILAPYRGSSAGGADPLGLRKGKGAAGMAGIVPDGTTSDGKPYVMSSNRAAEPLPHEDAALSPDSGTLTQQDIDNIKDPQARADLRLANTNRKAPMSSSAPAQAAAPLGDSGNPMPMNPPLDDRANPLAVMRRNNASTNADAVSDVPTPDEARDLRSLETNQRAAFLKGDDIKPFEEAVASLRQRIAARVKREREMRAAARQPI